MKGAIGPLSRLVWDRPGAQYHRFQRRTSSANAIDSKPTVLRAYAGFGLNSDDLCAPLRASDTL
jgi:hypothetical protein